MLLLALADSWCSCLHKTNIKTFVYGGRHRKSYLDRNQIRL